MRDRPWWIVATFWIATLSACSGEAPRPASSFRDRYIQATAGTMTAADAQRVTDELSKAVHREVEGCMKAVGFSYPQDPSASIDPPSDLSNREWVRKFGFGISTRAPTAEGSIKDNPLLVYRSSMTPSRGEAFDHAVGEQGSGGCLDKGDVAARRSLGIDDVDTRLNKLPDLSDFPEVQQAEADWRACASKAGVHADGLIELTRSFGGRLQVLDRANSAGIAVLQREEISTALAVFDCTVARNKVTTAFVANRLVNGP